MMLKFVGLGVFTTPLITALTCKSSTEFNIVCGKVINYEVDHEGTKQTVYTHQLTNCEIPDPDSIGEEECPNETDACYLSTPFINLDDQNDFMRLYADGGEGYTISGNKVGCLSADRHSAAIGDDKEVLHYCEAGSLENFQANKENNNGDWFCLCNENTCNNKIDLGYDLLMTMDAMFPDVDRKSAEQLIGLETDYEDSYDSGDTSDDEYTDNQSSVADSEDEAIYEVDGIYGDEQQNTTENDYDAEEQQRQEDLYRQQQEEEERRILQEEQRMAEQLEREIQAALERERIESERNTKIEHSVDYGQHYQDQGDQQEELEEQTDESNVRVSESIIKDEDSDATSSNLYFNLLIGVGAFAVIEFLILFHIFSSKKIPCMKDGVVVSQQVAYPEGTALEKSD